MLEQILDYLRASHPTPRTPEEIRDHLGLPRKYIKPVWDVLDDPEVRRMHVMRHGKNEFRLKHAP